MNAGIMFKIGTWQCWHGVCLIVLGSSTPNYTEAQLNQMAKDNAAGRLAVMMGAQKIFHCKPSAALTYITTPHFWSFATKDLKI
ncbi:MAG: hypothetical protein RR900_05765 [Ruthenibacterium sp.]